MPTLGNCQPIQDKIDHLQAEIDSLQAEIDNLLHEASPSDRAQIQRHVEQDQRQIQQDQFQIINLMRQLEQCLLSPHIPANLLLVSGEADAQSMKDAGGSPQIHIQFDLFNPNSSAVNITHSALFIMSPGGWKGSGQGT